MKLILVVASMVLSVGFISAKAEDTHDKQVKELQAIKTELKPLREKAYLESDVIATRHKLDEAYKAYWESVRVAMLRLDPAKEKMIEKDMALRIQTGAISKGSRAEDYEKKAAAKEAK